MAYVKVKECLTSPSQLVKLIFLVVCVSITIYQLSECVSKILHPPITSYYKFRYNTTLKYPSLTVCRRPSYKTYLFPKFGVKQSTTDLSSIDAFKTFDFENHSLEEFLNATTFSFEETIPLYGYKGSGMGENIDVKKSFYPSRGQCHTITPKENVDKFSIATGYWFYLKHTTKDKSKDSNGLSTSGFEIHIHNEHDVIKEETAIDTEFLYIESSEDMFVTLSVQTYSQISTSEQPCSTDPTYTKSKCEETCWHNAIADQIGCTMPWLRNVRKTYPECTNHSQMNKIGNLFSDYMRTEFLEDCYCPISCNNSIYKYHIESRKDCDAIQAPSSTINIYFPSNLITDLSEVVSYDWNIFLADVGGSMGFLLGLSVIGIVRVLEDIFRMVFQRKQKEEKEKTKREHEQKLPYLKTDSTLEGESLKSVMEFVANCDMYQHMQEEKMIQKESKNLKF